MSSSSARFVTGILVAIVEAPSSVSVSVSVSSSMVDLDAVEKSFLFGENDVWKWEILLLALLTLEMLGARKMNIPLPLPGCACDRNSRCCGWRRRQRMLLRMR